MTSLLNFKEARKRFQALYVMGHNTNYKAVQNLKNAQKGYPNDINGQEWLKNGGQKGKNNTITQKVTNYSKMINSFQKWRNWS